MLYTGQIPKIDVNKVNLQARLKTFVKAASSTTLQTYLIYN